VFHNDTRKRKRKMIIMAARGKQIALPPWKPEKNHSLDPYRNVLHKLPKLGLYNLKFLYNL